MAMRFLERDVPVAIRVICLQALQAIRQWLWSGASEALLVELPNYEGNPEPIRLFSVSSWPGVQGIYRQSAAEDDEDSLIGLWQVEIEDLLFASEDYQVGYAPYERCPIGYEAYLTDQKRLSELRQYIDELLDRRVDEVLESAPPKLPQPNPGGIYCALRDGIWKACRERVRLKTALKMEYANGWAKFVSSLKRPIITRYCVGPEYLALLAPLLGDPERAIEEVVSDRLDIGTDPTRTDAHFWTAKQCADLQAALAWVEDGALPDIDEEILRKADGKLLIYDWACTKAMSVCYPSASAHGH